MFSKQSDTWEYNCPQFVNFQECDDTGLDAYFETDHENHQENIALNGQDGALQGNINGEKSGKLVRNIIFGNENVDSHNPFPSSKKPSYSSTKAIHREKQNDYTLRLTPFRESRANSYCSVYQKNNEALLSGKGEKYLKPYNLRVTPARKSRSKSCFMFHKLDLEDNAHDIKHCYNISKEQVDDPMIIPTSNSGEMVDSLKNVANILHSTEASEGTDILKRPFSPESNNYPVKKARYTFQCKGQTIRKSSKKAIGQQKSSEEQRKEVLLKSRQRSTTVKKASAGHSSRLSELPNPRHTIIKPFHFETDSRVKDCKDKEEYKKVDFISSLRRNSPRQPKLVYRTTKPEPFNFSQIKKRKPDAEQKNKELRNEGSKKNKSQIAMQPRTPKLLAVKRNRRVSYISQESKEDLEALEMKKWKFQAKPINPSVFAQPSLPRLEPKPLTKIGRKSLATEKRFQTRQTKSQLDEEEKYEFHAQPFPKKIFVTPAVSGIKERAKLQQTLPKSPAFALKTRSQKWKESNTAYKEISKTEKTFRAKPVPEFLAPTVTKMEKKCTSIEPFSFDAKDKLRQNIKQQKILEEMEKEKQMAQFKANPLPAMSSGPTGCHKVAKKSITKPQPFNFQIAQLASETASKWQKEMESQLKLQEQAAIFKANPATVIKKPPFCPEKSSKLLTVCNTFQLSTERRASEWTKFEECIKAKQVENEEKLLQVQTEREQKEREELARLRKETVHRANPVRHYKPFELKLSDKPATRPVSPRFATSLRTRERV